MNRQFFACCFLLLCASAASVAQVGIQDVAITPRPNPYLMSWGKLGDSLRIRVYNSDTVSRSIRLPITLLKGDTVVAMTDPYMSPDLLVQPGTTFFHAEQIIWPQAIQLHRNYTRNVLPSGRLLPGDYRLCVGCEERFGIVRNGRGPVFRIEPWPAVHPIYPLSGDTVSLPVILRWNDIALYPEDRIGYRIRIVPLYSGQSPDTAFRVNPPLFEYTASTTDWTLGGREVPDSVPACVWSVQALDEEGYPIGKGWAEPMVLVLKESR
jgi:hypothetical protein